MMRVRGIAFGILILLCPAAKTRLWAGEQNVTAGTALLNTGRVAAPETASAETGGERADIFIDEPRPFGYVIGDLVERSITVLAAEPARLQADSIPKPGRDSVWLELRKADLVSREESESTRYRLTLTYQIINVAPEVQTIELPPLHLNFGVGFDGAQPFTREIAGWPITVAPLTPEFVLARAGLEALRPDRAPFLIDTGAHRLRLWLYAALFVMVLSSYIWLRYGAMWFVRKPFARACREIGKLDRDRPQSQSRDSYRAALRAMHRAFDETNGTTVFSEHVGKFLDRQPRFAALRTEIEQFFALSRDEFFGGGEASPARKPDIASTTASTTFLRSFCRAMRECEAARSDAPLAT